MFDALVGLVGLCFAAFFVFGVYISVEAWYYQLRLGEGLRRDLGFEHASPHIRCGRRWVEVVTIASLVPDGVFAQAGFRAGDIIKGPSISGLYKLLHRSRGGEARLTIIEGGNGLPLDQRPERELTVWVPPIGQVTGC